MDLPSPLPRIGARRRAAYLKHGPLLLLLTLVAVTGVLAAYGSTVNFGFRYDDYHMVRPWTTREIRDVLHGSWDPTGIEPRFYRPLAALWYALRFALFGVNASAQHVITLAMLTLCAVLAGLFVWRESGHVYAAAAAAGLYALYPPFVYAQAIWLTNQMHLFSSLIVLLALLVWQRARRVGGGAWWLLLVLQVIAFGFKEDTIMLLPVLLASSLLRRWVLGNGGVPSSAVWIAAAALLVALPSWRYLALGRHLGGYGMPGFARGWSNLSGGLGLFLDRPWKRPWQEATGCYSAACVIFGAGAALIRRNRVSVYIIGCGAIIAVAFDLPFYLVAKAEQYHLVGLGCVVAIAGGLDGLQSSWRSRTARHAIGAIALIPAICFLPVTRSLATDFDPCSPITLATDAIVLDWQVVPSELKEWIRRKPVSCQAGVTPEPMIASIASATWAYPQEIDEGGRPSHWIGGHAVVLWRRSASRADISVRSPVASRDAPTSVVLRSNAGAVRVTLDDTGWHTQTVRFRDSIWTRLRGTYRLDIDVSPVFVPAERFRNGDTRTLGALMRIDQ